jgi:N-dimethylarginine dimethylaminohydrolase
MCRPTYYTVAYEINPWMRLTRQPNHRLAVKQWNILYRLLTQQLGAQVRLLPPHPSVPDLVFTANAGLAAGPPTNWQFETESSHRTRLSTETVSAHRTVRPVGGGARRTLIRSNFRFPQRQREAPLVERYFRRAGYRIVSLPPRFDFEGEGDALWMGETLVFGFRYRSTAPAHAHLARRLRTEVLPVELVDRRFYHLDTCFCPLNASTALWYPKAFDRYGRKVIERLVEDLVSVSERDAMRFVCNAIVVGRSVVLPGGFSQAVRRQLTRRGFRLYLVDLSEFLKAGGAAKCLVLRLS